MADEKSEDQKLAQILVRDERYRREAYRFVQQGLEYTMQRRGRRGHVSGRELVLGLRDLAREHFGLMARTVLNQWGIKSTADFGEIVFNLIEEEIMSKQDSDTRGDFEDIFDFEEAFERDMKIELED
ncbi:MAG TPA: Minf_1886 family protein [Planctomycetota bacterium]|nr:Minf_1886 family protein [Planctomycetota bacterium]